MPLSESPITLLLILINVLVSGYALFMDPALLGRLAFRPVRVLRDREWYRLISAGFVHAGVAHLAFNLITLYYFGPFLEAMLGPVRFIVVYFGAELAAHALSLVMHRNDESYSAVGASGAISGVVFAFCLFRPFAKLYLFFALPIPAWIFAIGFVVVSVYAMRGQDEERGGRIAHEAHLGGAIGGLLLTILLEPRALTTFLSQIGF